MAERVRVMFTEEEVDKRIRELGEQISKDYAGKTVHLICVLKGGSFYMTELAKRITVPVTLDFMTPLDDMSALSRTIYITPAAEKLYKQNIKYLRILGNCGAITDVNISCQKYGESIVPQTILFRATANNSESKGSKERLLYFDVLRVWN